MANNSNIFAWRISWTEEPGGLPLGSQRVGHDWGTNWRRQWHPIPVLLPGKSHGRRSLVGCRPWGRYELDTTEQLHFHFSLSCIGEGNGNPLQCSCLENPRDRGSWWAAVFGVAQSRTRLKRLSSSSSRGTNTHTHTPHTIWILSDVLFTRNSFQRKTFAMQFWKRSSTYNWFCWALRFMKYTIMI